MDRWGGSKSAARASGGWCLDTTTGQVWRTHLGPGGGRVDPEATFFGQKLEADKEK